MTKEMVSIHKKCILGVNTKVKAVNLIDLERVLYACGNHVLIWNTQTKTQEFVYQCTNEEEIQTIELFSERRQIAIAIRKPCESHILILDLISLKRQKVIKVHEDDDSGVISLSFSIDGTKCLVLQDAPSFNMTLWNIEKSAKVIARIRLATPSGKIIRTATIQPKIDSNKELVVCASGNGLLRFFKVADGIFRPITVKIRREQQKYVAQCWLTNDIVILGTDNNELIVMHSFSEKHSVPIVAWDQHIKSMISFSHGIIVGGSKGSIHVYNCIDDNEYLPSLSKAMILDENRDSEVIATDKADTEDFVICLVANGRIIKVPLYDKNVSIGEDMVPWYHTMGADGSSVRCMDTSIMKPIVATAGSDKTLRIWNFESNQFQLIRTFETDIISLSLHPSSLQILLCFKKHVELNYIHCDALSLTWRRDAETNGSSCFCNGGQYFALVCGSVVQIYDTYKFDTICTVHGHSSPINAISWRSDDQEFATIGSDNVICIWTTSNGKRKLRYVDQDRNFTGGCFDDTLSLALVNTNSRLCIFEVSNSSCHDTATLSNHVKVHYWLNGMIVGTFIDSPQGDVWISALKVDQSMEIHRQKRLHSQKISCVCFSRSLLFTASDDGSMCISELFTTNVAKNDVNTNALSYISTTFEPFLVSEHELNEKNSRIKELRKEIYQIKQEQRLELDEMDRLHKEKVSVLKCKIDAASTALQQLKEHHKYEITTRQNEFKSSFDATALELQVDIEKLRLKHEHEVQSEEMRMDDFVLAQRQQLQDKEEEKEKLIERFARDEESMIFEMEENLQLEIQKYNDLVKEKNELMTNNKDMIDATEKDADEEMDADDNAFQEAILKERRVSYRLRGETDITKKKFDSIRNDYEEHRETILSLKEKQDQLSDSILKLKQIQLDQEVELKQLDKSIINADIAINIATVETHKMEKLKLDQTQRIHDLKDILESKEKELKMLQNQSDDYDKDLKAAQQYNDNLRVEVESIEAQLKSVNNQLATQTKQVQLKEKEVSLLASKLQGLCAYLKDPIELRRRLVTLLNEYDGKNRASLAAADISSSLSIEERQLSLLRQKIERKRDIIEKNKELHKRRVRKLKRDQQMLEAQLKDVQVDAGNKAKQQPTIMH